MPHGTIAGFDRPLAESELVLETALSVSREYGDELEDAEFRAEQEERIKEVINPRDLETDIKLSPAGFIVGVNVALGTDEIQSTHIEAIKNNMTDLVSDMKEVDSFAVPTAFKGFGDSTDTMVYSIRAE